MEKFLDDHEQIDEEEKKLEESYEVHQSDDSKEVFLTKEPKEFSETVVSLKHADTAVEEEETARAMKNEAKTIVEQLKELKRR